MKGKMENVKQELSERDAKYLESAQQKGASAWLTCRPIEKFGYTLNKREFTDSICLRYGWQIKDIPKSCACGSKNDIDHSLSCLKGGYSHMRHNAIRDAEISILNDVCADVKKEPDLIPVGDVEFNAGTTDKDKARLDISAVGVWRSHERTFFDVRIAHPHAPSYTNKSVKQVLQAAEHEKMRKYNERILNVERASFVPLVFSTNGAMGDQCAKLNKQVAKLISEKKGEQYSVVMTHIRCRLRIALLKCVLIAIRGYRGPAKKSAADLIPVGEMDFGLMEVKD